MIESGLTDITHLLGESGELPTLCHPDTNGWVPHGRCVAYRENGVLLLEISYDRGLAHGPYRDFWPNGQVSLEGQYINGRQEGEWRFYDPDPGALRERLHFVAGREIVDWNEFFRTARSES